MLGEGLGVGAVFGVYGHYNVIFSLWPIHIYIYGQQMITETIYIPNLATQEDTSLLEHTLMVLEGVNRISFDLPAKRLIVSYAESAMISVIKQAIEESGYALGPDLGIYPAVRKRQSVLTCNV